MRPGNDPTTPDIGEEPAPAAWSQLAQDIAATLWPSFLAASVATMFFFAFVDPDLFGASPARPQWLSSRTAGYAVGFFFFWAICILSSSLTLYLVRTSRGGRQRPGR